MSFDARHLPDRLIQEITAGNCVAFVGGGFSALAVPPWRQLLQGACAACENERTRERVGDILSRDNLQAVDLEAAAQLLQDGRRREFVRSIRHLAAPREIDPRTLQRREWLRGIPFAAILTTNFDGVLDGELPSPKSYLQVLRPKGHRWWNERFWAGDRVGPEVVKLHGDITRDETEQRIVLSRRDYRQRLYESPGYTTFLKALFVTKTVLYLGCSFTDAYVNELRSEVLSLVGHQETDQPLAFAVINDVDAEEQAYQRRHEGIEILSYRAGDDDEFQGFDAYLEALYRATNPGYILGRCLAGRRLLWLDPKPRNNDYGKEFLQSSAALAETSPCTIETVDFWDEAIARLEDCGERPYDLILSHWGYRLATDDEGRPCAAGEKLLVEKSRRGLPGPVLVFSGGTHGHVNRPVALRLGASEYCQAWDQLFQQIARVLAGDRATPSPAGPWGPELAAVGLGGV